MMMSENTQSYVPMNNTPKNRKTLIILLIVVISIIFLGGIGYGIYNFVKHREMEKIEEKKKKAEQKKEKEESELELLDSDSSFVTNFFNVYISSINNPCGIDDYFGKEKILAKDISNVNVFSMMSREIFKENNKLYTLNIGDGFSGNELNNKIVKYFGKKYKYNHKNIDGCFPFTYDQSKNYYMISNKATCPTVCNYPTYKRVTKAQKSKSLLVLSVRVLFSDGTGKYYKDYSKQNLLTDLVRDANGRYDTYYSNFSQGSLYKMRFVKEDNNYVFESSELVEGA